MTSFRPVRVAVCYHALGIVNRFGERLLDEHVGAGLHRLDRVIRVRVGKRVD